MHHNPTPSLPEFDYVKPASLAEASKFLAEHAGEARPLLGGTDIFVRMRDGFWKDRYLVDLKGLDGLGEISFDPKKGLSIGAAVNMNDVACCPEVLGNYPVLSEACRTVASYQLRTRATIAGNICNASPAGDTIPACLVLEGSVKVYGPSGERVLPLKGFFTGPGKSVLGPGDIVTHVLLPVPPKGFAARYVKLGRNAVGDLAVVGVAVLAYPDSGGKSGHTWRMAVASVAPTPLLLDKAASVLTEKTFGEATVAEAAEVAMNSVSPIDDVRSSARYRSLMVRNITRRAVNEVWAKLNGGGK